MFSFKDVTRFSAMLIKRKVGASSPMSLGISVRTFSLGEASAKEVNKNIRTTSENNRQLRQTDCFSFFSTSERELHVVAEF